MEPWLFLYFDGVIGNTQGKPWVIGQDFDGSDISDYFKGQIDEVGVYNHTLTDAEINSIYNSAKYENNSFDGVIAHYSFDNVAAGNSTLQDDSGNGNTGKINGTFTTVDSLRGKGLVFDGLKTHVELTNLKVPETFTVSAWLKADSTTSGQSFLAKNDLVGNNQFILGYYDGYNVTVGRGYDDYGLKQKTDSYQHLVSVVRKIGSSKSEVKLYKNGELIGESILNDVLSTESGKPWCIGAEWDAGVLGDYFKGQMDDLKIYGRDLNQKEISELYLNNEDGLLAYYSFDNSTASDDSGNNNNGILKGNPTFIDSPRGKALKLDGIDDYVELSDFKAQENLSIAMWVKPNVGKASQYIVSKNDALGNNIVLFGYYNGLLNVTLREPYYDFKDGTLVGEYQHLVAVIAKESPTQSRVKLYKDKVLIGETTLNSTIGNTAGKPWSIGQEYDGNVLSDFFSGEIDEVAIYNHDLCVEEVKSIYDKSVVVSQKKTNKYIYDKGGNINKKIEYTYKTGKAETTLNEIDYTYDSVWKDKLSHFNKISIEYDEIGNPVSYNGNKYEWEEGRQLKSITTASKKISYKYNDSGIRTEKNVGGIATEYHLIGDKVTFESTGTEGLYYTYDSSGHLVSMTLSKENADKTWTIIAEYYYIRNAQGDIIGLFDKTGAQVVSYLYDSWGKLISINGTLASTVGVKNPYRYRGYRYDIETGLYYLQSRYYNPEWGRFIKTDALVGQNGQLLNHNMFAYCANSPVTIKATSGFAHRLAAEDGGTYVPFDNGKIVPYESVAKKLSKDYTVITTVLI